MNISIELFPNYEFIKIINNFKNLIVFNPKFYTITFSFKNNKNYNNTLLFCLNLSKFGFKVTPHFPCVNMSKIHVNKIFNILINNKIYNTLILRGDGNGVINFNNSYKLMKYIKKKFREINIFSPGYPETHTGYGCYKKDIKNLKRKYFIGIKGVITQFFFNICCYKKFIFNMKKEKINTDVFLGLLLIKDYNKIKKISRMCSVRIPKILNVKIKKNINKYFYYILYLIKNVEYKFLHLYTLNDIEITYKLLSEL